MTELGEIANTLLPYVAGVLVFAGIHYALKHVENAFIARQGDYDATLINRVCVTTTDVSQFGGQVLLDETYFSARTDDPSTFIKAGRRAMVLSVEREGATQVLVVREEPIKVYG